ncbi:MAG: hypothetical protein IJ745_04265 [Bacteroidales bacterium]|nr:hypothetical protein [Bacteroidales bacterium]
MNARKILVLVFSALTLSACVDDGGAFAEARTLNTASVGGRDYTLVSRYAESPDGHGYADAVSTEQDEGGLALLDIRADVDPRAIDREIDLTRRYTGFSYSFSIGRGDGTIIATQDMQGGTPYGSLAGEGYGYAVFSSGSLAVCKNGETFTYRVEGTLRNGQDVAFSLCVPAAEWVTLER